MIIISKEQAVKIHSELIKATGGSDGIRDEGLLESALSTPFQSFDGVDAYPGVIQKAVRLGYGLIKNHAFIDGNKRIGVHLMLVFLALNKIELVYTQNELSDCVLKVASGDFSFDDLLKWTLEHQA